MTAGLGSWSQLLVPRFKCGHEKTPANSVTAGDYPRCKTCHNGKRGVQADPGRFRCGHERTPANTYANYGGGYCKTCHLARCKEKRNKNNGLSVGRPTAGPACAASR